MDYEIDELDVEVLRAKLRDAMEPGILIDFDPAEADAAGVFIESALDEHDAFDSVSDWDFDDLPFHGPRL